MTESTSRPRVFFDIHCGSDYFGRIVIELFNDQVPKTCKNFRAICTASFFPPLATKPLTYKRSPFHRVIDEFMLQGGDITAGDGTGGASIYGVEFEDENNGWREIDEEGLICMAKRGKGTNSSQFFITLAPCPHLNAKHTVFGQILSGKETLMRMAKVPVDANDRPLSEITISNCGELERHINHPAASPNHPSNTLSIQSSSSNNRGRKPAPPPQSGSRSQSLTNSAPSPAQHSPNPPHPRRRSDFAIDETRRGRSLSRSRSPHSSHNPHYNHHHHHHHHHHHRPRKRSPPPSRSRSRRGSSSRSPHLRRRRTRTRTRSRSPRRGRVAGHGARRERERWRDEEIIAREEREREGRGRWEGVIEREGTDVGGAAREKSATGAAGAAGAAGGPEVKFKGRGSMKYRERK